MGNYVITDSEKLLTIMRVMNSKTFGLRFSEKIVGGRARLERLITTGKIRAEKATEKPRTANGWLTLPMSYDMQEQNENKEDK